MLAVSFDESEVENEVVEVVEIGKVVNSGGSIEAAGSPWWECMLADAVAIGFLHRSVAQFGAMGLFVIGESFLTPKKLLNVTIRRWSISAPKTFKSVLWFANCTLTLWRFHFEQRGKFGDEGMFKPLSFSISPILPFNWLSVAMKIWIL